MELDTLPNITTQLPAEVTQNKHIPLGRVGNKPKPHRRTRNHLIRAAAKRYAQSNNPQLCEELGLACVHSPTYCWYQYRPDEKTNTNPGARRLHFEKDLRNEILYPDLPSRQRASRNPRRWISDEDDGRDLAHSAIALPSDHSRIVRRPSLERQDAFRDANTCKGNVHLRRSEPVTEDAEIAELYRMGLLYDNEQDRGEGFSLNSIDHEEPVHTIRPAKRARRHSKARGYDLDQPLHLDLSFTDLGGDDAIAQYLMSSAMTDLAADESNGGPSEQTHREFAPLRVIYEVDGSQPSFDVDTSQPPDLISDILSDYDCFSDSELDDLPSQREVQDSAATPGTDAWIVLGDDS